MYESLKKNLDNFHLYIFAFDNLCFEILNNLKPSNTTIIPLEEFENEELLKVKKDRSRAEYCWTATPSTITYIFENYNVSSCTYIDADLFFYHSPAVLIREMDKNASVLITEHRFSKLAELYEGKRAGRFCVQFITFNGSPESKRILNKWKNQCIEWCYSRYEDGKFGDQKYLDDWPENYNNIHILEHLGGGVAPWNIRQYKIENEGDSLTGIHRSTGEKFNIIFYHFQYVKLMNNGYIDIGWYYLTGDVIKKLYIPYLRRIFETERKLREMNPEYKTCYIGFKSGSLKDFLKALFKRITKYNLIKQEDI